MLHSLRRRKERRLTTPFLTIAPSNFIVTVMYANELPAPSNSLAEKAQSYSTATTTYYSQASHICRNRKRDTHTTKEIAFDIIAEKY